MSATTGQTMSGQTQSGRTEFPPGTTDIGQTAIHVASDGTELRYRTLRAEAERGVVVYLHGLESHGGWFLPMAARLKERGYTVHLLDRRGAGLNRHTGTGDADSADQLLDDVRGFRDVVGDCHLIGLSWGGKLALASALRDPDRLRSLSLITPGLVPRIDLEPTEKVRLLWKTLTRQSALFEVPIEPDMFTLTPRYLGYIEQDPLRLEHVTNRFLLAGLRLDALIKRGVEGLRVPTLLLLAENDRIIDNSRTRELLERAPSDLVDVKLYEGATHSIQFDDMEDLERDLLWSFDRSQPARPTS